MRKPGWEERLLETVAEWEAKPFQWGKADCIGFALACGKAVRGKTLFKALPRYGDAKRARRVLRDMGARELENAMMMHLDPVPVALAQRGAIGIVIDNGMQCAVVCTGPHWVGKTEGGLIRVPGHLVIRAFKV
jgi:hypothetical protein